MDKQFIAVRSESLSSKYEARYVIIDTQTGEIVDDAQGYGYKSKKKAYAAYFYKTRDKSKDKEMRKRQNEIKKWMKSHKEFMDTFEVELFDWYKYEDENSSMLEFTKQFFDEYKPDDVFFTPNEFIKVYKRSFF